MDFVRHFFPRNMHKKFQIPQQTIQLFFIQRN